MRNRRVNGESAHRFRSSSGRTSNDAEADVVSRLEVAGWTVLKNGWPDLLAFRGDEIRLLEVKPNGHYNLSQRQWRMASALRRFFGVEVEVVHPECFALRSMERPSLQAVVNNTTTRRAEGVTP